MKKFIILFIALFFGYYSYSQSPQKFTYQSIVRKADGSILKTSSLGMRISILKNSKTGNSVYSETHTVSTNKNGLATLLIGDGTSSDTFSEIDWALGEYFLKVEVDPTGGINYSIEQSSQLLSVPYSFYSSSSANIDLTEDVLKILPIENGGTGSATAPMVSVITAANASVARDSLGLGNIAIQDKASVNLEGGTIDGTSIGTTTASTGSFTILSIASSAASSGSLKLLEATDNGNNDITLKSPNDLTASISWTLPSSDGSDGQLLKTDGSGTLSFMTISSDSIEDAESDTKIQVEETADENIIRFDIGVDDVAVEQLVLADGILKPTTTNDIDLGSSTLGFKNAYIDGTVTSAALAVAGTSTLTGNVAAAGDLAVAGASTLTGNVAASGDLAVAGASTLTGNVAASGDLAVAGASTLTGNVIAEGSVDITGAAGLILEKDQTITNSTDGTVLITSPITKMSAALEVVGATTLSGGLSLSSAIASNPVLEIKNTIGDNATSGILQFVKAKTTLSSDDDDAGVILFKADNTAVEQISFGKILVEVSEADDTDEAGKLSLSVASSNGTNSSLTDGLVLTGSPSDGKVDVTIGAGASGVLTIPGNIAVAGTSTLTGNVAAAGDLAVAGASTLTGNVVAAGSVDITGAGGLILENDQTITNSTNGTILITAPITKMSAALEVVGATTLSGGLSLSSATASNPVVEIKNTTADASAGILKLTKDRGAAGVAGDDAGSIQFFGEDDGENAVMFSEIKSEANVVTDGEEGGKFTVSVASNDGTSTDGLIIVDGSEAGELDVTIGAGANSNVIVPGNIAVVGSIGAVGDIAAAGTLVAIGDTSAGDDGAIGRTDVEGLILTGQGTTNDITIKNSADNAVLKIPQGTTNVDIAGTVTAGTDIIAGGDLTVGGDDITFGNSETISNSTNNNIVITSATTRVTGALVVDGDLDLDSSVNAGDYNKIAGRVTLGSTTTIVSNSYVTTTSIIMLTWATDITDKDSALRVWINAQSAGSFTIKTSANASGEKINFLVIN